MNSEDILLSLLGLCDISIPKSIEGINYQKYMEGKEEDLGNEALITCEQPFGQWNRLVTQRYAYVKDLK